MTKLSKLILGIDPGKTTGWALARKDPALPGGFKWLKMGDCSYDCFNEFFLERVPKVDIVVCEDYVLNPNVKKWQPAAQIYNTLYTKGLVGRIELTCYLFNVKLRLYESKIKPMGYKMNGLPYDPKSKRKERHQWDAMAHVRVLLRNEFDL